MSACTEKENTDSVQPLLILLKTGEKSQIEDYSYCSSDGGLHAESDRSPSSTK